MTYLPSYAQFWRMWYPSPLNMHEYTSNVTQTQAEGLKSVLGLIHLRGWCRVAYV